MVLNFFIDMFIICYLNNKLIFFLSFLFFGIFVGDIIIENLLCDSFLLLFIFCELIKY